MAVAKVNLLSDLDALALYPLKRLLRMQHKDSDQHNYRRAAGEYAARLRQLYRVNLEAKSRRCQRQRRAARSATLKLDGEQLAVAGGRLHGITIERSSFACASQDERVVLVEAGASEDCTENGVEKGAKKGDEKGDENGAFEGQILAHGIVQSATENNIKIKLFEPLILLDQNCDHQAISISEATGPERQQDGPIEAAKSEPETSGASHHQSKSSDIFEQTGPKRTIYFRIKYDLAAIGSKSDGPPVVPLDECSQLVRATLKRFEELKCDLAIYKNLLGFYDERANLLREKARLVSFEELAKPRGQQRLAIEQAIKRRLSLIEGPAGSGKTLVGAHIAANMSRLRRAKVLVCSPLQANVDALAELIGQIDGVQVVKLPEGPIKLTLGEVLGQGQPKRVDRPGASASGRPESDASQTGRYLLDKLVDDEIYLQAWNRSKDTLRNHHDSLHSHAYRMVTSCSQHRRRELQAKILTRADVVCCTNKQSGSHLLTGCKFDMLILDDLQVSSEIDCLVPLVMARGVRQVVLLSDSRKRVRLARANGRPLASVLAPVSSQQSSIDRVSSTTSTIKKSQRQANGTTKSNQNSSLRRKQQRRAQATGALPPQTNGVPPRPQSGALEEALSGRPEVGSRPLNETTTTATTTTTVAAVLEPGGLFERLLAIGLPTVDLRVQFRLHETLSNFTSNHFYLGRLKNDPETNAKLAAEIEASLLGADEARFAWLPNRKYLTAMFNVDTGNREAAAIEAPASSSSSLVKREPRDGFKLKMNIVMEKLDQIVGKLLFQENIQESRLGIILNRRLERDAAELKQLPKGIHLGTIADFTGQERDFIILVALPKEAGADDEQERQSARAQLATCSQIECDFRRDDAALNCALTRARLGLMLIVAGVASAHGSMEISSSAAQIERAPTMGHSDGDDECRGWTDLVQYYRNSKLYV